MIRLPEEPMHVQTVGSLNCSAAAGDPIIHFDRHIDHAVLLGTFEEIRVGSFEIHNREGLRDPKKWRNTYSDHFPVTVQLEATPDDDPAAKIGTVGRRLN